MTLCDYDISLIVTKTATKKSLHYRRCLLTFPQPFHDVVTESQPHKGFIRNALWLVNVFLPVPRVSVIGIERFRCPIDPMDEDPDDILDLFLILYVILRPRFGVLPYAHSHGQPFGKLEDILICFIIADEKQASLP